MPSVAVRPPTVTTLPPGGAAWSNLTSLDVHNPNQISGPFNHALALGQTTTLLVGSGLDLSAVPDGAAITGYKVGWRLKQNFNEPPGDLEHGAAACASLRLLLGGVPAGADRAAEWGNPAGFLPFALELREVGGDGQLWGLPPTTGADLKAAGVGVGVAVSNPTGPTTGIYADLAELTVFWA